MITVKLKLGLLLLCCYVIQGECLEVERLGTGSDLNNITKLSKDVMVVQTFPQLLGAALQRETWSAAEQPCERSLRRALADADNFTLYAVWMLDAMQLPSGQLSGSASHLGNYDECMEPRWRRSHPDLNTQYCLADVQLVTSQPHTGYVPDPEHTAETYLKTRTYHDLDLGVMYWGLCLPAGCPKSAVTKIYRILLRVSHLGHVADDAVINLNYCQVAGQDNRTYDNIKMVGFVMASLLAVTMCSTYYVKNYKLNPKSYAHEILRSFCLKRNYASLTSVFEDEVYSINVMRLFMTVFVVCSHNLTTFIPKLMNNGLRSFFFKDFDENAHPTMWDNTVAVDMFFTISGLLMVRGFLGSKLASPLKFVFKRYARCISLLSIAIFVKTVALSELGDGPMWAPLMDVERDICQRYGWLTLAMLQDLAGSTKHCLLPAWSTAVDFHLYLLGVLLCVIYRKNARLGIYIFSLACLVLLPMPGYIQNKHGLPVTLFYGFESIRDMRKNRNAPLFASPHTRAGPFLLGMMMGWILLKYKPAHYQKRILKIASYIYLVLCLAVMTSMAQLGGMYYKDPTAAGSAVFTSLFRTVFAAAVCGVIALAEYGDLGILKSFFEWSPWVPLSRLTYGVYILHFLIVERNVYISRNSYHIDGFTSLCSGLGIAMVTFFFSFILYLLVEAPLLHVVGLLLNGPRGSKQDSAKINATPTEAETISRPFEDKKMQ